MAFVTGVLLYDVLGVITAFIVLVIAYYKWSFQYWKKRNVPCVEPSIPFGNFPSPFKSSYALGIGLPTIYQQAKSKGWKYVGIYAICKPFFMVVDLDILKYILVKDFNNFVDRGTYFNEKDDPISAHLFAIGGQKWKGLRAKLSPTFTSGKLKAMFQTLVNTGKVLEDFCEERRKTGEPIEAKDVLGCFTTDIISSVAFGLEINSFKDPNTPIKAYATKFLSPSILSSSLTLFGQSFPSLAQRLGVRAVMKDVSDFFTKIVTDTVNYRERTSSSRKDFLQMLIDMKNNKDLQQNGTKGDANSLTMDEIVAQCFVFFLGGFETSSTTMSFALFELATNPEIQEKLRNEIITVLGQHDNKITYDSLSEMKYLSQVIDETLRKYPPVVFITRVTAEDYKIPGEDVVLESGTLILIPVEAFQHDEEYFPNPKVFDPDRFNDKNKIGRQQYSHLPFGGGPRVCIGERFGIMQTKVGLASILRNSKVVLNKKTEVPLKMATSTLVPTVEGGIWINIVKP